MTTSGSSAGRTYRNVLILLLFTAANIFLALNRHSHGPRHSYHGELWADRAGYFVYLPALFEYGMVAEYVPTGLDTLTGRGFILDEARNTITTKYTYGVALLQAPFYLLGHGCAALLGINDGGFGTVDHVAVAVAACCYLTFALAILYCVLKSRFGSGLSSLVLMLVYVGSNLYYYTIGDPGMSHVYSFFLFAAALGIFSRLSTDEGNRKWLVLLGLVAGLIVLVRPTNIVFLLFAPLVVQYAGPVAGRYAFLHARKIPMLLIPPISICLPQLFYWKYAYGSYLVWSYSGEGFSNWSEPRIASFLLSTNNGLLPYAPLVLLVPWGCGLLWLERDRITTIAVLAPFALVSFFGASWWVWHFGCGFGSRTLVEYMALAAIPIATWVNWSMAKWGRLVPVIVGLVLVIHQLKMVYSYGDCWFHGDWNWEAYAQLVFGPTK